MAGGVVTLEQAKSGRSTCRASGEPIAKGEWRVGFETWISGRVAMAWMVRAALLVLTLPVHFRLQSGLLLSSGVAAGAHQQTFCWSAASAGQHMVWLPVDPECPAASAPANPRAEAAAVPGELLPRGVCSIGWGLPGHLQVNRWVLQSKLAVRPGHLLLRAGG